VWLNLEVPKEGKAQEASTMRSLKEPKRAFGSKVAIVSMIAYILWPINGLK
jgi:hypothetical protein